MPPPGLAAPDASDGDVRPLDGAGDVLFSDGVADGEPHDAAARPGLDAAAIPEIANCLASPYEMHVTASGGYGGLDGAYGVDGTRGTWSSRILSSSFLQLDIAVDQGWGLVLASDYVNGHYLEAGTYVARTGFETRFPYAQVEVNGKACSDIPVGSFTLVDLGSTGGDQAAATYLLAWFDLQCGDAGRLRGCVRYGR